jgi:pimeloyl-ACP methyl ester carboxylesterase
MPTIELDGTSIHYERAGDGPPLLFVHGLGGHAGAWADQAGRFMARHACVRYDRRGHGASAPGDRAVTHAVHSDDAVALIETLELAPCVLVASSLGGVIALDVVRRRPELVRGLVVSEPPLFSIDAVAGQALMTELAPQVRPAIEERSPRAFIDAFYAAVCPGLWSTLDDDGRDAYRANGAIGMIDLQSPPLEITVDDLAAIEVPALVISGDRSHPSLRRIAHELAAAMRDARFVELEGSGHVTYAEQPDAFATAVGAFLAERGATAGAA